MNYPFQIRPGTWAHLDLPDDLTVADVRRLEAFLLALVNGVTLNAVTGQWQTAEASPFDGRGVLHDGSTPERMRS